MPRNYRHIQQYEQEMIELKEKGWTVKAIGEKYGLSYEQAHGFFKRYNRKQKKLAEGIEVNGRGRPRIDGTKLPPSIQQLSKLSQMKYEIASKDRYIKRLEMENELMRDFLSLTERK